jgi:DNA-binding CsgD family transcriptional regulator
MSPTVAHPTTSTIVRDATSKGPRGRPPADLIPVERDKHREAARLFVLGGLSIEQLMERYGCSRATVYNYIGRGLRQDHPIARGLRNAPIARRFTASA